METSLHRQLKERYASAGGQIEAPLGSYRIDVLRDDEVVEIQHGALTAIRDKIRRLLKKHRVLVVKPIIARKRLIKRSRKGGKVVSERLSPKRGRDIDLFSELMYFTRVFPHRNLKIEVPLVDIEEWRYPGHGRRRWRRDNDHIVEDQKLVTVHDVLSFRSAADLMQLIPNDLPDPFDTAQLAHGLGTRRSMAQRIAYCLRMTGATEAVGKKGNAWLYRRCA